MAPWHGGSSAGKSGLCCGHSLDVVGRPGSHQSGLMSICFAGCLSLGPRKNDLTIYWALGPFVRSFTLLVDPGDIYPPHLYYNNCIHFTNYMGPKSLGNYFLKCPEFPCSLIFRVLVPLYLVKLESFPSGNSVLLIQDSTRVL
jgi:hypothetical protein